MELPSGPGEQQPRGLSPAGLAVLVLCLVFLGDCLAYRFLERGTLRGVDFLLIAGAAFFVALAILRPARIRALGAPLLALAMSLLSIEAALTLASPAQSSPWHVWPPNIRRQMTPIDLPGVGPSATFTTNSLGIRGREMADHDSLRILCVGGSTTECIYLDDALAWPQLLADRLAPLGPVWVGNAGRSGLMSVDHETYLAHAPEAELADVWVVLVGVNDMMYQLTGTYDDFARRTWERTFIHRRPGLRGSLRRPFHRNLFAVSLLEETRLVVERRLLGIGSGAFQDPRGDWVRRMREERAAGPVCDELPPLDGFLAEYRRRLETLVHLSRTRGKRLVLLTQPTLFADPMPTEHEALLVGGRMPDGRYLSSRQLFRAMESYNDVMRDLALARDVECVDLARLLPRSTETFYDGCHFNESGAAATAGHVAAALRR